MKTATEILEMEGVVVRRIAKTTRSLYAFRTDREYEESDTTKIIEVNGRKMVEVIKPNSLGGKYVLTFVQGQDASVLFRLGDGFGDTIEEAYADYLKKHGTTDDAR